MKKLGKILGILAAVLALGAMLNVGIFALWEVLLMDYEFIPAVLGTVPSLLAYTLLLACAVPLIFLVGRKKGGPVLEILLLVFMIFCIPVINGVAKYVWYYVSILIRVLLDASPSFDVVEYIADLIEEALSLKYLYQIGQEYTAGYLFRMMVSELADGYLQEKPEYFLLYSTEITRLICANLAQILTYVVCGISIGLLAKNKKAKKLENVTVEAE